VHSIEQRRAAVSEALQAGSLTSADVADLASRFGCSHRTIRGDALRVRRRQSGPALCVLSAPATRPDLDWRTTSAEDARVWMLEQLAGVASDRSAGSAAGVGAVRAMVPIFAALVDSRAPHPAASVATRDPAELLDRLRSAAREMPETVRESLRRSLQST